MRHGRCEHRGGGAHGFLPVLRLEELVLRRSARAREGRDRVLHGAEGRDDALVLMIAAKDRGRRVRDILQSSTSPYYVLFFLSGFPALIYQIVWQRALFTFRSEEHTSELQSRFGIS